MNNTVPLILMSTFFILSGLICISFRKELSRAAREERARLRPIGPLTQSPEVFALLGGVFVAAGVGLIIAALMGWITVQE